MPYRRSCSVAAVGLLFGAQPAAGCEPIAVWVVLAGPHLLPMTVSGLVGVIAAKCLAFAFLARDISPLRRPLYMLSGNAVSSVVGFLVAIPLISPVALFAFVIVLFILGALLASPVERLRTLTGWSGFGKVAAIGSLVLGLFLTLVFYSLAQEALREDAFSTYWALKILYIAAAFGIGVFVTVLFEEWTIWKLAGPAGVSKNWFVPVVQANLFAFLLAGGIAATIMLPKRLRSPNFLVDLMETLRAVLA